MGDALPLKASLQRLICNEPRLTRPSDVLLSRSRIETRLLLVVQLASKLLTSGPYCSKQYDAWRIEILGKLCVLTTKIQQLKQSVASDETRNVDYYYAVIGLSMMTTIIEEEVADKQRKKVVATLQAVQTTIQVHQIQYSNTKPEPETNAASKTNSSNVSSCKTRVKSNENKATKTSSNTNVFQGAFCRDLCWDIIRKKQGAAE
ncbi:hypothetical protein V6N11_001383 [Hibiscus sabdariffa]|uniref:Uncharacterized protein n=1 Tax=Hibiscus sabdariffa TaxID=183260 RepID=A0ABR2RZU8_9ROSI